MIKTDNNFDNDEKVGAERYDFSLLERLTFSPPKTSKKLCVKAVKIALNNPSFFAKTEPKKNKNANCKPKINK